MKIKCKVCNKEFEAVPQPITKCGTLVTSKSSKSVSVVDSICPECKAKLDKTER